MCAGEQVQARGRGAWKGSFEDGEEEGIEEGRAWWAELSVMRLLCSRQRKGTDRWVRRTREQDFNPHLWG